ncbi:CPSF A subunit region-domain-containing protein [Lipomyces kononenkoae]|uniref:CPSF A subunit region-domain-containing protein n=1 Tax=Lipomyces kononenkoae TaxID=34357 RepID=A0ACC3STB9_LIPKO
MSYAVSIHKPTSVRHAVCTDLVAPGVYSLILARPASIDVYAIQSGGLSLQYSLPVNGTITSLLTFKPTTSLTSWLFVLTEDCIGFTLSYKDGYLVTEQVSTDLDERFLPDTDTEHIAIMDPQFRAILLHTHKSSLTYIPLVQAPTSNKKRVTKPPATTAGTNFPQLTGTLYPARRLPIEELIIISIIFLENAERPTIAVLYRDGQHARHVKVYEINAMGNALEEVKGSGLRNVDQGASLLMPFPTGGFFLLGEQLLTYFPPTNSKDPKPKKIPFNGPINFCAWACIDESGKRFLLGDELGQIYILQVRLGCDSDFPSVIDWKIENIGETSIPTTLTYLGSGFFFVTSHFSPSTLFYLSAEEPHVKTVQVIPNLAPITDFQLADRENTTDIIACSGGFKSGSLRIIRSGIGVDTLAEIAGIKGVTSLWTFDNDIVVASFVEHTMVVKCDPESGIFEELPGWWHIVPDEPTIEMAEHGCRGVHINRSSVTIVDTTNGRLISRYKSQQISVAAITPHAIIIANSLTELVGLSWDLTVISKMTLLDEISCITATEDLCVVGLWNEVRASLYSLPDLNRVGYAENLVGGNVRSLKVSTLDSIPEPILFLGMADGTLHSYHLSPSTAMDGELTEHKITVLGTQPVTLYSLKNSIFAVSSHPSMIYGHAKKITISSVNVQAPTALAICKDTCIADDSESSDVLLFATDDKITYGVIDQLMSTHVQTLELKETARRLTIMSPAAGVIGLITLKTELDSYSGDEIINCSVKIVDSSLFDVADSFALQENEMAESIVSGFFDGTEYLVVGTGFAADREEYTKGRILVFEVTTEKKLSLVLQSELHGGVYALCEVKGNLVCAVNAIVRLCIISTNPVTGSLDFKLQCGFRAPVMAITLSTYEDYVLVGDLMKSVALLQVRKVSSTEGVEYMFHEVARYYEPMWMTDVEILDEKTSIGTEAEGNIVVFQREEMTDMKNSSFMSKNDEDPVLEIISSMRVGEVVNRIRRSMFACGWSNDLDILTTAPVTKQSTDISVADPVVIPQAYYATRDGAIYLYGQISSEHINNLINLQSNMSKIVKSAGELKTSAYRAFSNQRRKLLEPVRFVDGDFIEQFLELSQLEKEQTVQGANGGVNLNLTVGQVTGIVEDLKRLR